jgi:thymidylate synthase ThyX
MKGFSFKDFTNLSDLNSDEPIEDVKLDLEKVKENIVNFSDEKVAEMIICDRTFGFEQKISAICMKEIARRRVAGNTFNFEEYIKEKEKEMPSLDFKIPDLSGVIKTVMEGIKGKL